MQPLPRVVRVHREVPNREPIYITVLSDLHLESRLCDRAGLRRVLEERAKLPRHSVVLIGDVLDLVGYQDAKRYRQSVQIDRLHGIDGWVNEAVEHAVETLTVDGIDYDLVSPGNHEDEWLKRHGLDVTSILANRLGAARGGYSGAVDYVLRFAGGTAAKVNFRLLYHHGAWGGKYAKGYMGAKDLAHRTDGWHVFVYGHCHAARHDVERRQRFRTSRGHDGELESYDVHIVNASSWVDAYSADARVTHYAERAGYVHQPRCAPLLTVVPIKTENRQSVEYTVTM